MPHTQWLEHPYPARVNADRCQAGTDRCASRGAGNVRDLRDLLNEGYVVSPDTGHRLTTAALQTDGVWIFAVKHGRMRLGPDGGRRPRVSTDPPLPTDAIKHETLFHNQPVSAAGEIRIWRGIITGINHFSGTYMFSFDAAFKGAVREALLDAGAEIGKVLGRKLS